MLSKAVALKRTCLTLFLIMHCCHLTCGAEALDNLLYFRTITEV